MNSQVEKIWGFPGYTIPLMADSKKLLECYLLEYLTEVIPVNVYVGRNVSAKLMPNPVHCIRRPTWRTLNTNNIMFHCITSHIITGLPNRLVLFCSLASVVVCNAAGGRAGRVSGRPPPGRAVRRRTLHGGPARLRSVRATPCIEIILWINLEKGKWHSEIWIKGAIGKIHWEPQV